MADNGNGGSGAVSVFSMVLLVIVVIVILYFVVYKGFFGKKEIDVNVKTPSGYYLEKSRIYTG